MKYQPELHLWDAEGEEKNPDRRKAKRLFRDLRRPVLEGISPSYILDPNFQFIDWNPAFYELFAKPFRLRLGMHVSYFLTKFANCDDVMERSMKVFAPGKHPIVDTELLLIETEKYGVIHAQKIATQIIDDSGRKKAWIVSLNILAADKLEELWQNVTACIEKNVHWSNFGICMDTLCRTFPSYSRALFEITSRVKESQRCLDLHAGTGNLTSQLLAASPGRIVWSNEFNEMMLETMKMKVSHLLGKEDAKRSTISKATMDQLEEYTSESFDSVVSLDGIHRIEDVPACLEHIHRILKPEGNFVFVTFHSKTNMPRFLNKLKSHLKQMVSSERLDASLDVLDRTLIYLDKDLKRFSKAQLREMLYKTHFKIIDEQSLFGGEAILIEAQK